MILQRILFLATICLLLATGAQSQALPRAGSNYYQQPSQPYNYEIVIFRVVEEMPRFPNLDCEEMPAGKAKQKCADDALLAFIKANLQYPEAAKAAGLQGTNVVTFVVERDGTLSDLKLVRDIGSGCGEAALRVVQLMNEMGISWIPGIQDGNKARVQFNLPVIFRLW